MDRDPPSWHPATPATKTLCKQAATYPYPYPEP